MKKYLLLLLFIPFVFSCSKEDSDEPDTLNLQIGDMYAGGIVFQTGNGEGGMIAMTVDSGAMSWGQAMQLESNGWFVPSISQLETLYFSIGQGADNIGNFADATYWSSSDYTSGNDKWVLNFSSGKSNHYNQVLNFRVLLISYF